MGKKSVKGRLLTLFLWEGMDSLIVVVMMPKMAHFRE